MRKQFFTLGALLLMLVFAAGCSGKQTTGKSRQQKAVNSSAGKQRGKTKDGQPKKTSPVKAVGSDIKLSWWDEQGRPRFSAKATRMSGDTVSGTGYLESVSAKMYSKGQFVGTMTAPLVTADQKTGIVTATGGVTIVSYTPKSNIKTIKAGRVRWFTKQDKIWGDGGIIAKGPTSSMKATAFTSDSRLIKINIYANPSEAQAAFGGR